MAEAPADAVFFPFPAQGHVAPALHLAKLLHARGSVRVTFVHSERNHRRVLRSRGATALDGAPGFRFDTVALFFSIRSCVPHFKKVIDDASISGTPVTCVVSNMDYILLTAREMGFPAVAFWTASACGFMAFLQCKQLIDRSLIPLKDAEQLSNGYLDSTVVDWVPGMPAAMRLRDFVSFIRTADPDDAVLTTFMSYMECLRTTSSAIVLNTFDDLEGEVLDRPGAAHATGVHGWPARAGHVATGRSQLDVMGANLWPEDGSCLEWLQGKQPRSVLYVNFGSLVVLTRQQLEELAWGIAKSGHQFLWVIRHDDYDKAKGDDGDGDPIDMLSPEFAEETKGRGYVTRWCPQEALLRQEAIGAFLTHCGWNSMLGSICNGIPTMCYPVNADQPTNCRYACTEWRIGVELGDDYDIERQGW